MAGKTVDLKKSVYALCGEDAEIAEIMAGIGFKDILKPGMLNTAGRFMTISKGAALKGVDMETIKKEFLLKGFKIEGEG